MKVARRWAVSILAALAAFVGCWWGLLTYTKLDSGVAVGVAAVPFTIVLTLGGVWADRARSKDHSPESIDTAHVVNSDVSGTLAGAHFGPGGDYRHANILIGSSQHRTQGHDQTPSAIEPYRTVYGEIPQRPMSFEDRPELQDQLTIAPSLDGVVFVVTGIRGAGKSQLAGAIARKRLAEGWRLVAWINAEDPGQLVEELGQLAVELGLNREGSGAKASALRLRHWLESDGTQCLLVLDNATNANVIRPLLPVAGRAQLIVTSSRRTLASIGRPLDVGVFTPAQAAAFLSTRTGRNDETGAQAVAADLGYLPLALSQAAAVIVGQNLDYATYRARLADMRVADYLTHTEGDPYTLGVVEAIMLSISAVEAHASGQICRQVLELVPVLSPSGVSRQLLYGAQQSKPYAFPAIPEGTESLPAIKMQPRIGSEADIDAALQELSDSSLLNWTIDGLLVSVHRLVARVVTERADHDQTLSATACRAIDILALMIRRRSKTKRDLPDVSTREVTTHTLALNETLARFQRVIDPTHSDLLALSIHIAKSYRMGYDHSGRHAHAKKLEQQGRLDEAITELEQLLAEMKEQTHIPAAVEYAREVREDLDHILERHASQDAKHHLRRGRVFGLFLAGAESLASADQPAGARLARLNPGRMSGAERDGVFLPHGPGAGQSLGNALREAQARHDTQFSTEHLALGLLAVDEGLVPPILSALGCQRRRCAPRS